MNEVDANGIFGRSVVTVDYGCTVVYPRPAGRFIPPTQRELFVGACWRVWDSVVQIALYLGLIVSFMLVARGVLH